MAFSPNLKIIPQKHVPKRLATSLAQIKPNNKVTRRMTPMLRYTGHDFCLCFSIIKPRPVIPMPINR
jgi:hypothetical protein